MRISDWSSDVCSSDLVIHAAAPCPPEAKRRMIEWWGPVINEFYGDTETGVITFLDSAEAQRKPGSAGRVGPNAARSEESRVGEEWVSQCRYRWSQSH